MKNRFNSILGLRFRLIGGRLITTLAFCLLLVFSQPAAAQRYYTRVYTEADGLLNSSVLDLAQDNEGVLWFATRDGVSSFDGVEWKSYRYPLELP